MNQVLMFQMFKAIVKAQLLLYFSLDVELIGQAGIDQYNWCVNLSNKNKLDYLKL